MKSKYLIWRRLLLATLVFLAVLLLNLFFYNYLQRITLSTAEVSRMLAFSLDTAIPLEPMFVWIYMTHVAFMSLPFYLNILPNQFHLAEIFIHLARENHRFSGQISQKILHYGERCARFWGGVCDFIFGYENDGATAWKIKVQTVLAYLFLILSTNAVYYFWPLKVLRPNVKELVGAGADFLRWLYRHDDPNNTFPSQHAAFATLVFLIFNRLREKPQFFSWFGIRISVIGAITGAWAFCIILSTYFTKQHIIADSVAGVIFACVAFSIGFSEWLYARLAKLGRFFVRRPTI